MSDDPQKKLPDLPFVHDDAEHVRRLQQRDLDRRAQIARDAAADAAQAAVLTPLRPPLLPFVHDDSENVRRTPQHHHVYAGHIESGAEFGALFRQPGLPELLTGALLTFKGKTSEGQLIATVGSVWLEILRALTRDPNAVMQMSPRQWEMFVAGCYEREGYKVTLTSESRDFGRDLIAEGPDGKIRLVDQVKRNKPGRLVKYDEVRALLFVADKDKATKCFLTTTSNFPSRLLKDKFIAPEIERGFLELRPREKTFEWLQELSKKT